jgi:hypothetical protein
MTISGGLKSRTIGEIVGIIAHHGLECEFQLGGGIEMDGVAMIIVGEGDGTAQLGRFVGVDGEEGEGG